MPRSIDYYFTLDSPWSYIGHGAFMTVMRRHDALVRYHPVNLSLVFPQSGGLPLAKRNPLRQRYRMLELQRWRERRRLDFNLKPAFWPFESALADRAVLALIRSGADPEAVLPRAYAAVWEDERDLADPTVLASLIEAAGLDAHAILAAAATEALAEAYDTGSRTALKAGVFGTPSYGLDGEIFWGQDRIDFLEAALASGRQPFTA
ncbi:MAG TPA: 2-hydroxychromene-2-carboxylate isomerase [Lichenihabitans sp.]|jgi:2-hydroxychromene-2-carboxylate isomerase|nr:2-hydroxychromene-2-carboxylate isomerase [Lichenihabitans sp.]